MPAAVRPGDVAVLVRYNRHAVLVRDALDDVGIPSVINGAGSVFATPAAREWLRLLEALERPASPVRARAATMTSFLGWTAERVAAAGDDEWEEVHRRLHAWAAVLRRRGLASLSETITLVERLPGRVLGVVDGERRLTDLRHVGQLLHGAASAEKLGAAALAVWLRARIATAETEGDEERSRRLESDAAAVQVLTIHRSKGLEFPVVYVPYLWEPTWVDDKPVPIVYHDREAGIRRTIDVGLAGSDYQRHKDWHIEEQRGEDLRLAYVALTRARHQAVIWWAASWNSKDSALSRLLFARDAEGNVAASGPRPPADEVALARFRELAAAAPGCVSVESHRPARPPGRLVGRAASPRLTERRRLRPHPGPRLAPHLLQRHHRRRPRSPRLQRTRGGRRHRRAGRRGPPIHAPARGGDLAARGEPLYPPERRPPPRRRATPRRARTAASSPDAASAPAAGAPPAPDATPSLFDLAPPDSPPAPAPARALSGRRGRARRGPFHSRGRARAGPRSAPSPTRCSRRPTSPRPTSTPSSRARSAAALARRPVDIGDRATMIAGLRAAIETPLGPLVGGLRLRDVQRADRLDELTFELPLVGGDEPTGELTPGAIGAVLRAHLRRGRSARGLRRSARGPRAAGQRARLPHRQHRPRGAGRRGVRDRGLQDELARRAGRGADGLASPPGGAQRPRWSTPTTACRRCSTPRPCTATCAGGCAATTPSAISPACSTCSCAG